MMTLICRFVTKFRESVLCSRSFDRDAALSDIKYQQYDKYIADLRRAKGDVRRIRQSMSQPTGNFVEDMATGNYEEN